MDCPCGELSAVNSLRFIVCYELYLNCPIVLSGALFAVNRSAVNC
jgi:hypothetical protein